MSKQRYTLEHLAKTPGLAQNTTYKYNASLPLNYTVSDPNLDECWYNLDDGDNTTLTNCVNATFNTSEGSHTLYLFANDTSGNINNTESIGFTIDMTPPQIEFVSPTDSDSVTVSRNYTYVNVTVTDTSDTSSSDQLI